MKVVVVSLELSVGIDQDSHLAVSLAVLLHVRQWDGLEAVVPTAGDNAAHIFQLVLAQVVDNAGADRVAQHVNGRSESGIFDSTISERDV